MATIESPDLLPADQKATTLDEDLKNIRDAKYDHVLEATVCGWIGKIIGRAKPGSEPASIWLKSGDVLCTLMNCIRPGTIPKYNINTTSKFKQMENISLFLRACREVGMLEKDLFSTIDLYEVKDMNTVILTLFNLGGTIQSTIPYFTGPTIGIKQTNRKFQIVPPIKNAVAPSPPISHPPVVVAQVMPPVVPQTAIPKVEPLAPQLPVMQTMLVAPAPPVELIESLKHVPAYRPPTVEIVPAFTPEPIAPKEHPPVREAAVTPPARRVELPDTPPEKLAAVVPVQPVGSISSTAPSLDLDIKPRLRQPLNTYKPGRPPVAATQMAPQPMPGYTQMYAGGLQQQLPPNPTSQSQYFLPNNPPGPSVFYSSLPMHPVASATYQGYGSHLLKQVNAAAMSQFGQYQFPSITGTVAGPASTGKRQIMPQDGSSAAMEHAVQEWIECVLREQKPGYVSLFQWLQSGEVLCRLMNTILGLSPNPNFRISSIASNMHAQADQMENTRKFMHVCKALGVKETDTFSATEFFEGTQNGYACALNCVFCLGGVLQNYEWWVVSGNPQLGRRIKINAA